MRYHEIASGMRMPVSAEEQALLNRIGEDGIAIDSLDEREHEVARLMVNRGLLTRFRDKEGALAYRNSSVKDIWRDRS